MLKTLLRLRMASLWNVFAGRLGSKGKKRGKLMTLLIALFALYVVGCLFFVLGMLFHSVCQVLVNTGMTWLYFGTVALMAAGICIVGSIFITQSQLFEATDNELLLSMPIRPSLILLSRMLSLLGLNYIYGAVVLVPGAVVYAMAASPGPRFYALYILCSLLLPMLFMAITGVVGYLLALITRKLPYKNLFTALFMIVFFVGYLYLYLNLNQYAATLIQNGAAIGQAIQKALPPIYHFGQAVSGSWSSLAFFILWCAVPIGLVYALLSRSFLKIATTRQATVRKKYRAAPMRQRSVRGALLRKEWSRLFSCPMYVFNCAIGSVMMLILGGVVLVKGPDVLQMFSTPLLEGYVTQYIPPIMTGILAFAAIMNITTAPSISLEGRNLWLLKSLPIRPLDIFLAKLGVNLIIGIPPLLVADVCVLLAFPMTAAQTAVLLAVPLLVQVAAALFGLLANLWFPRFDWTSEAAVVKQSGSVFVSVFGGMALIALPVIVYAAWAKDAISFGLFGLICAALLALACLGMVAYLGTAGTRRFERL